MSDGAKRRCDKCGGTRECVVAQFWSGCWCDKRKPVPPLPDDAWDTAAEPITNPMWPFTTSWYMPAGARPPRVTATIRPIKPLTTIVASYRCQTCNSLSTFEPQAVATGQLCPCGGPLRIIPGTLTNFGSPP